MGRRGKKKDEDDYDNSMTRNDDHSNNYRNDYDDRRRDSRAPKGNDSFSSRSRNDLIDRRRHSENNSGSIDYDSPRDRRDFNGGARGFNPRRRGRGRVGSNRGHNQSYFRFDRRELNYNDQRNPFNCSENNNGESILHSEENFIPLNQNEPVPDRVDNVPKLPESTEVANNNKTKETSDPPAKKTVAKQSESSDSSSESEEEVDVSKVKQEFNVKNIKKEPVTKKAPSSSESSDSEDSDDAKGKKVEEDIVCLGKVKNFENLVSEDESKVKDDEQKKENSCKLCDKKVSKLFLY